MMAQAMARRNRSSSLKPGKSRAALGACYRRMCPRMDQPKAVTKAVTNAAHKLARLIYTMLTEGVEYTEQGRDCCEERFRVRVRRSLLQRSATPGLKMVLIEPPA
jgi:hypothetical protein